MSQRTSTSSTTRSMATPSYLDILPEDVHENVIRCLSSRPNRIDAYNFISPDDLPRILNSNSSLACAAVSLFSSITDGKHGDYDHCGAWPPCSCLSTADNANAYVAGHFPAVLQYCGSHAKHIAFSKVQDLKLVSAQAVVTYATAMESLSLFSTLAVDEFDMILQSRGSQLNKLHVNSIRPEMALSIANHCPTLSQLTLIDGANNLTTILEGVGRNLTHLEVKNAMNETSINIIRANCPNLKHIRLWCLPQNYDYLVDLCRFYGPQLEFAWIHHFSALQCRRVAENCSNIRVEIDIMSDVVDTLQSLSSTAKNVSLSLEQQHDFDKSKIGNALAMCTDIRRLHLYGLDRADDDILLELFKRSSNAPSSLLELGIQHSIDLRANEIAALANITGQLRTLKITVDSVDLSPKCMASLISQNPNLERVRLFLLNFDPMDKNSSPLPSEDGSEVNIVTGSDDELLIPEPEGEWFLYDLVRVFGAASKLREFVVLPFPFQRSCWDYLYCVEDACMESGLRHRRIHVSVLNVDYLPVVVEDEDWDEQQWVDNDGSDFGYSDASNYS